VLLKGIEKSQSILLISTPLLDLYSITLISNKEKKSEQPEGIGELVRLLNSKVYTEH